MKKLALAILILAFPGIGAQEGRRMAKDYPKSGVYWSKSWSEAWGEALNRNVPVSVHKDDSEDCAAMAELYRGRSFIDASRMWVNLMVHPGAAHDADIEIAGKRVPRCEIYFDITCKDHADADAQFPKLLKKTAGEPLRIFLNPKVTDLAQREIARETGVARVSDLLKSMEKVQARMPGEKMSADEWRKGKALLAEAEDDFKKKNWQQSIKAFRKAAKIGSYFESWMTAGLNKINTEGEFLYAKAFDSQPKDGKGEFTETKRILRKIIVDFKSLPIEEKAKAYLDGLTKHGH